MSPIFGRGVVHSEAPSPQPFTRYPVLVGTYVKERDNDKEEMVRLVLYSGLKIYLFIL